MTPLLRAADVDSQLLMQGKGLWEQERRGHRSGRAAALKLIETHTAQGWGKSPGVWGLQGSNRSLESDGVGLSDDLCRVRSPNRLGICRQAGGRSPRGSEEGQRRRRQNLRQVRLLKPRPLKDSAVGGWRENRSRC